MRQSNSSKVFVSALLLAGWSSACDPVRIIDSIENQHATPTTPAGQGPGTAPTPAARDAGTVISSDAGTPVPAGCHCTRRPGVRNSVYKCPMGIGESGSAVIGPEGGLVTLVAQQNQQSNIAVALDIPPGAIATPTKITITELADAPPANLSDWSPLYRFDPPGLVFAKPAKLRMPWSNVDGEVPRDLAVYWSNDGGQSFAPLAEDYTNAGFNDVAVSSTGVGLVASPTLDDPARCQ